MSNSQFLLIIIVSGLCVAFLRALPFLAFRGNRQMPDWLERLGKILPASLMAVLVVYCLKDIGDDFVGDGIPRLIAVAVVVLTYKWKHSTLISIVGGTAAYMILLRLM